MADNLTTASAAPATPVAGTIIATRSVTYSGDTGAQIAPVGLVTFAGSDDAKTATDVTATNPLPTSGGTLTPASPAAASVGTSSGQAVAANANRKALLLVNTSTNTIYLGFAATAVIGSGVALYPGGSFGPFPNVIGAVNAIASGASSNLAIQEFT